MKKRIISFVLLLAMILTMIPVMASAEETAPTVENGSTTSTETAGDLHDWYVQDGLTALYSTFGVNNGVDLANGKWTAKVGTGEATLGTKDRWSVGEYGGIGYTVLYGTVAEDGSYVKDSAFNNHNVPGLALTFGLDQLNNGDFTVDYMAMYKPLYVANTDGSILVKDGAKVESYDAFGEKQLPPVSLLRRTRPSISSVGCPLGLTVSTTLIGKADAVSCTGSIIRPTGMIPLAERTTATFFMRSPRAILSRPTASSIPIRCGWMRLSPRLPQRRRVPRMLP